MPGTIAHINRGFMFCKLSQCDASGGKDPQWYAVHEGVHDTLRYRDVPMQRC